MEPIEFLSMLGCPARLAGRMPIIARYLSGPARTLTSTRRYAANRYGVTYSLRPWLKLDIGELEQIEQMINQTSDDAVLQFRQAQFTTGNTVTIAGSILAATCATVLTLESLSDVNLTVRAIFTISLMISVMSVYFTLIQQRELNLLATAPLFRDWLWNGKWHYKEQSDAEKAAERVPVLVKESSLTANVLLQFPFELLSIAITLFLGGVAAYLGLAMREKVTLGTGHIPNNQALLVAFLVATGIVLMAFGQALGQKDMEKERCEAETERMKAATAQ